MTLAPAIAASCPTTASYTAPMNTTSYKRTNSTSGSGTAKTSATGAPTVTYTVRSTAGAGTTILNPNLSVAGDTQNGYNGQGDLASGGMQIQQNGSAAGQSITFTFSRPITNLSFLVADIDANGKLYADSVYFSVAPTTVSNGTAVTGAGTAASPLRSTGTTEVTSDTLANRSTVTFKGPLTSLTITYASTTGTTAQQIFLKGISFTAATC